MDNQNPTPASGGAHGGFAPASNTSAPYGASQAQPGEPGTVAAPSFQPTPIVTTPTAVFRLNTPFLKNTADPTAMPPAISAAPATSTLSVLSAPAWGPWRLPSTPGWLWVYVPSR